MSSYNQSDYRSNLTSEVVSEYDQEENIEYVDIRDKEAMY